MRERPRRLSTVMLLAVAWFPAVAGAAPTKKHLEMTSRTSIDGACDALRRSAEAHPDAGITFWNVAGPLPSASDGLWWRVDDIRRWAIADLDPLGPHGPNTQVMVWSTPDNVLLASAFFTSDSGDWADFVDYCYRPDGTLARTTSTFNSFVAGNVPDGIRRERTRYFDTMGKATGSRSSVSNLATGKPLQIRITGYDEPAYMAVEELPFYPLLRPALGS